jgi:hypothetical protein
MTSNELQYVFINADNIAINTCVILEENLSILNSLKELYNATNAFEIKKDYPVLIGETYWNGTKFINNHAEYKSWIWNDTDYTWSPPIEYPSDGNYYEWNEDLINWQVVENINI